MTFDGDGRFVWIETRPNDGIGGYGIQFRFWFSFVAYGFSFGVRLKIVMSYATNVGKDE